MTSGNREAELETEVERLEATVRSLGEQLVEANERIRRLEKALSGDITEAQAVYDGGAETDDGLLAKLDESDLPWGEDAGPIGGGTLEADPDGVEADGARPVPGAEREGYERQFETDDADPEEVARAAGQVETAAGTLDDEPAAEGEEPLGNTPKGGEDDTEDEDEDIIVA